MKVLIGLSGFALVLPVPTAVHASCRFTATRIVGCFPDDADLAARAYQRFKGNTSELSSQSVKDVLASAGCRVIVSSPERPFHIFRRGHGQIATLNGYEPISIVEFKTATGHEIFSVDSRWIEGECDEAPPGCMADEPCNPHP